MNIIVLYITENNEYHSFAYQERHIISRTILATNYSQDSIVPVFRFHLIHIYLKHSIPITNMFVSHDTIEEHLLSGNMLI